MGVIRRPKQRKVKRRWIPISLVGSGGTPATALLTEASDPLVLENGDYLVTES